MRRNGVSLLEVLLAITIITVASIGTLNFFAYGWGSGINKQGNRRAALERTRQRLEQLMATNLSALPAVDGTVPANAQPIVWLRCAGSPCTWTASSAKMTEPVLVDELPNQPMETTVQWVDDVDSPPPGQTDQPDMLAMDVKVWFTANTTVDDDVHRVHLRTLRTP